MIIVLVLTLVTIIYGYINSHNTKITAYTVTLKKELKENIDNICCCKIDKKIVSKSKY